MTRLHVLAIASLGSLLVAGCTVDFDYDDEGTFRCDATTQCVDDQECLPNSSGTLVCKEPDETCVDGDDDGYGSPKSTSLRPCDACDGGDTPACTEFDDCDDNASQHPGRTERCNAKDLDCDGDQFETPGEGCTPISNGGDGCPLPDSAIPDDQSGASWRCEEVEGTFQCVLRGDFSGSNSCDMSIPEEDKIGVCERSGDNQDWTKVAEECRTSG